MGQMIFKYGRSGEGRLERLMATTLRAIFEASQLPEQFRITDGDIYSIEDAKGDLIITWTHIKSAATCKCFEDAWHDENESNIEHLVLRTWDVLGVPSFHTPWPSDAKKPPGPKSPGVKRSKTAKP